MLSFERDPVLKNEHAFRDAVFRRAANRSVDIAWGWMAIVIEMMMIPPSIVDCHKFVRLVERIKAVRREREEWETVFAVVSSSRSV